MNSDNLVRGRLSARLQDFVYSVFYSDFLTFFVHY